MKKKLFQKRSLIFIIPAILLLVLLIAAAPGAILREHRYRNAVNSVHAGDLDAAQQIFAEIPRYRDSEIYLNSEIPYLKACSLVEAASAGDASMLSETEYELSDVHDDTTVPILLYRSALGIFTELGEYKDSPDKAEECRAGIENELTMLHEIAELESLRRSQERYDQAADLLSSGSYSEAISVFQELDGFSDSDLMISECCYQKALSIFNFLCNHDVSWISASISTDLKQATVFSIPPADASRLGNEYMEQLRAACGNDPVEVLQETDPDSSLIPLRDSLKDFFASLGDYKDSGTYSSRIDEKTDYTQDFFTLCSSGDLYAAKVWLNGYTGNFPDRERWSDLLDMYMPYCGNWEVYLGDAGLLPYTVGQGGSSMSISSKVILNRENAILRLFFGENGASSFDLPSAIGETLFINSDLDSGYYMGALNNRHFVYMRYGKDWQLLSSCDYIPA